MRSILFDQWGGIWDARSPKLAQHLGSSIAGETLAEYVVRNMGYVAADASDRSAKVRLRPAIAAQGAVRVFLCWLRYRRAERLLVSTFENGWRHELMSSDQATTRLV